ncbi:hypothetical protein QAD02_013399 [Eretmocerus hayati]|uniref:Uncharacterized protein n=1 Tax=Eretmocerus hayati TaxID=131215 RepID=A0ACC2P2K0_9HYME|nr:hypothetical protein QAD02_013399 [Eretmocerus hayati]
MSLRRRVILPAFCEDYREEIEERLTAIDEHHDLITEYCTLLEIRHEKALRKIRHLEQNLATLESAQKELLPKYLRLRELLSKQGVTISELTTKFESLKIKYPSEFPEIHTNPPSLSLNIQKD